MIALLAAHLAASVLAPLLARRFGRNAFLVLAAAPGAAAVWALWQAPAILGGGAMTESMNWAPGLGFRLDLRLDAFGVLMTLLVGGIGALVFCYSRWYFPDRPDLGRLATQFVAFAGAMFGVIVADNLIALYIFWELTSITSYLLIGFDDRSADARAAALRALLVTVSGGLTMLAGFVLIAQTAGTYSLSGILATRPAGPLSELGLLLVLIGAFAKSAQVPFHFWLPGAMTAPTPVSAYLHAATMVKAGVYLIARLAPAFAGVWYWRPLLITVGLASMLVGGWRALAQRDLKLLLAHGTISQLGILVLLFGAGFPAATAAGATLILAHAAFKGALFMVVGIVDKEAGTRDIRRLDALHRPLRATFAVAAIAAASMAGLPPLLGFLAKEAAFEAFAEAAGGAVSSMVLAALVAGAALTFAYSARFLWGTFASKSPDDLAPDHISETATRPAAGFVAPAAILSAVTLLFGILPGGISDLVVGAARSLDPRVPPHRLELWHGFKLAFVLSLASLLGGVLLWLRRRGVASFQQRYRLPWDAARFHDYTVAMLLRFANIMTGKMQTGSLPMYLMVILSTAVLIPGVILFTEARFWPESSLVDQPLQGVVAVVMVLATIAAVASKQRMAAVVATSVIGYSVAFLFVLQGAPDLALTQLLFETLLLVLFVLILRHLPPYFSARGGTEWKVLRTTLAIAVGAFAASIALIARGARVDPPISTEYIRRALPQGDGHNVVNVILVDFRAFDTFGEIMVLTAAALGVMGLIRAARRERGEPYEHRPAPIFRVSPILDPAARLLFHTVLLYSIVLLTVGHDRPGGGFIGGLVAGAAFILLYLAGGTPLFRRGEPARPELFLGSGITLAALIGILDWLHGAEFLEAMTLSLELPALGRLEIPSVYLFDFGVYLVVVGLVVALLSSAGREEVESP